MYLIDIYISVFNKTIIILHKWMQLFEYYCDVFRVCICYLWKRAWVSSKTTVIGFCFMLFQAMMIVAKQNIIPYWTLDSNKDEEWRYQYSDDNTDKESPAFPKRFMFLNRRERNIVDKSRTMLERNILYSFLWIKITNTLKKTMVKEHCFQNG